MVAARTLLQPAMPTTFGLVAATWLAGLDPAGAAGLAPQLVDRVLAARPHGSAGTTTSPRFR